METMKTINLYQPGKNILKATNQCKSKKNKILLLFFMNIVCCFVLTSNSISQITRDFGNWNFVKNQNNWFLKDRITQDTFLLNTETVTIKFKSSISSSSITFFERENKLTLLRENKLGYRDYNISSEMNVLDFIQYKALPSAIIDIVEPNTFGKYSATPNDASYATQWYLQSNVFIKAPQAWDFSTGCPTVTVGIIDAGTDWMHEDLGSGTDSYQNIYLNPAEDVWSNPNNPATGDGIDNDNNGFIDDWKGWDFGSNNNDPKNDKNKMPS